MRTKIQIRRGSSTSWENANPTLAEGEIGYESNTGNMKIGDGVTAWNDLPVWSGGGGNQSGWSGYSGFSGIDGVDGYAGESGYSGVSGDTGGQGDSGYSGQLGDSGYSGTDGLDGNDGNSGYSGQVGSSGYSGASGLNGAAAYSGYSGASGFDGADGFSGTSGDSGYSGVSGGPGDSGYSGVSGKSGYSGVDGLNGNEGTSGYSGIIGESGYSGKSGFDGAQGDSGFSGYSGVGLQGDSGYSGLNGEAASSGYSGTSGQDGSGYSGLSGNSGYSGQDGTSTSILDYTYEDLNLLVTGGALVAGQRYRITNFRTIHEIPETGGEYHEGSIEPLVVTAVTSGEFHVEAISDTYPTDSIRYNFTEGDYHWEGNPAPDKRGRILWRRDDHDNIVPYDSRACVWRRWEMTSGDGIYVSVQPTSGDYQDFPTWGNYSRTWGNEFGGYGYDQYGAFNNIFRGQTKGNKFHWDFINNTFLMDCHNNNFIASGIEFNIFYGDCEYNLIGGGFKYNIAYSDFFANTYHGGRSEMIRNRFWDLCESNEFMDYTHDNDFGWFLGNKVGYEFKNNMMKDSSIQYSVFEGQFSDATICPNADVQSCHFDGIRTFNLLDTGIGAADYRWSFNRIYEDSFDGAIFYINMPVTLQDRAQNYASIDNVNGSSFATFLNPVSGTNLNLAYFDYNGSTYGPFELEYYGVFCLQGAGGVFTIDRITGFNNQFRKITIVAEPGYTFYLVGTPLEDLQHGFFKWDGAIRLLGGEQVTLELIDENGLQTWREK